MTTKEATESSAELETTSSSSSSQSPTPAPSALPALASSPTTMTPESDASSTPPAQSEPQMSPIPEERGPERAFPPSKLGVDSALNLYTLNGRPVVEAGKIGGPLEAVAFRRAVEVCEANRKRFSAEQQFLAPLILLFPSRSGAEAAAEALDSFLKDAFVSSSSSSSAPSPPPPQNPDTVTTNDDGNLKPNEEEATSIVHPRAAVERASLISRRIREVLKEETAVEAEAGIISVVFDSREVRTIESELNDGLERCYSLLVEAEGDATVASDSNTTKTTTLFDMSRGGLSLASLLESCLIQLAHWLSVALDFPSLSALEPILKADSGEPNPRSTLRGFFKY